MQSRALFSTLCLLALVACACGGEVPADGDPAQADADLTTTPLALLCSKPVTSADGAFVLLDECPAATEPGRVVRLTTATGARDVVGTYPATDRITALAARGGAFVYARAKDVRPATTGVGAAIGDWEIVAGTFSLARRYAIERPASASAPAGHLDEADLPGRLGVTGDASHVWFLDGSGTGRGAWNRKLHVVPAEAPGAALAVSTAGFVHEDLSTGDGADRVLAPLVAPDDARLLLRSNDELQTIHLSPAPRADARVRYRLSLGSYSWGGDQTLFGYDGRRVLFKFRGTAAGPVTSGFADVDTTTGAVTRFDAAGWLQYEKALPNGDIVYESLSGPLGSPTERRLVRQRRVAGTAAQTLFQTSKPVRYVLAPSGTRALATEHGDPLAPSTVTSIPLDGSAPSVIGTFTALDVFSFLDVARYARGTADNGHTLVWFDVEAASPPKWRALSQRARSFDVGPDGASITASVSCDHGSSVVHVDATNHARTVLPCSPEPFGRFRLAIPDHAELIVLDGMSVDPPARFAATFIAP